jgi:hypothetical protein
VPIEVTEDNLRLYYIEKNIRIVDMSEIFGTPMGTLRKRLKSFGIHKTQKQASANIIKSKLSEDPDYFKKLNSDPAKQRRAQASGVIARRENKLKALAAEGATYEEVYRVYITENNSLTKTGEFFNRNKGQIRSLLKFYNIVKDPEVAAQARKDGFAKLYADPVRVAAMVAKTRETSLERYGNNWYHNTASKEEMAVRELIVERFPELEIVQGSYGVIRRPGSGGLMQLDFYFPEINFAVEYNGIYWHDKAAYLEDLSNGTMHSREAIKDHLCEVEGIELVHVWSDDFKNNRDVVLDKLFVKIEERKAIFSIREAA